MSKNALLVAFGLIALGALIFAFLYKKPTTATPPTGGTTGGRVGTPVTVDTTQLDCAAVSGKTGTLQIDGQQFYCSGTFQCTADGKITCQNPQYYYYPYYYNTWPWFFRGGHHGGDHHH